MNAYMLVLSGEEPLKLGFAFFEGSWKDLIGFMVMEDGDIHAAKSSNRCQGYALHGETYQMGLPSHLPTSTVMYMIILSVG